MLELQQAYPTGNPRRPYSWNSSSKGKLQECELLEAGSSGDIRIFRCNNCNVELPIAELRVRETEQSQLNYHNRKERPILYKDMLLCNFCMIQWREWMVDPGKYYEKIGARPHRGQRSSSDLERYEILPLARWCQAYWRNKIATEDGRVPLPGRQIPPSPSSQSLVAESKSTMTLTDNS